MVNVLPDAPDELPDRGRLVARWLERRFHADRYAALGFLGAGGPMRRPELAVLVQRVAAFDQRG
jgi:hypothetical protein